MKSLNKIIVDLENSYNNIIKLNSFTGNGKLFIKMTNAQNCLVEFGENNRITKGTLSILAIPHIGKTVPQGNCIIGNNNIFNGNLNISLPLGKDKNVKIGNNNLFANNINIVGLSEHMVYDIVTKNQTNKEMGVDIGNNIWIGTETNIINKSRIPNNSIVGRNSLVTKSFYQENTLIAGSPATIKRTNIGWHVSLDDSYLYTENPLNKL